jgi:hypothetical protein
VPLIIGEPYDLAFFATPGAVDAQLEPWYAEIDYVAWDALGRPLELVVVDAPPISGFMSRVRARGPSLEVRLRDSEPSGECVVFLREWLSRVGAPAMSANATLSDLLVQALIRGDLYR